MCNYEGRYSLKVQYKIHGNVILYRIHRAQKSSIKRSNEARDSARADLQVCKTKVKNIER